MLDHILNIIEVFTKRERRKFSIIVALMFVAAIMEMLSIGAVLPFINIIQNPVILENNEIITTIKDIFNLSEDNELLIFLLMLFVLLIVVKNLFTLFLTYIHIKFSLNKQAKLSVELFSAYLYMDYIQHKKRNSSILVRNVITESLNVLINSLLPLAMVISEGLIIICILGFVFYINPAVALSIALYGIALGGLFIYLLKPTMRKLAKKIQLNSGETLRYSQESFLGIKEIIISNSYKYHIDNFKNFIDIYARARTLSISFNAIPRALFEITFILIFASTIIILIFSDELSSGLPLLGVYAVAAFRLIPSLNRFSTALNQLNIGSVSLGTIKEDLKLYKVIVGSSTKKPKIKIKKEITLKNITFQFDSSLIIKNLNLSMSKGNIYALTGASGSGKTTLIDIITGLLIPENGKVMLDGKDISVLKRKYTDIISYVPQEVHIADDTVRANVAYGVLPSNVDDDEVWAALRSANIDSVIEKMSSGLDSILAENGKRLSGGQKQRIGIARALYSSPEFLVMDEPTAALDKKSEKEMMINLNNLKKSIIILLVTHSPQVIKFCDKELKLTNGAIKQYTLVRGEINARKFYIREK